MIIKSWMVIGAVTFGVALGSSFLKPNDIRWFSRLQRPRWLVFEPAIPIIWTIVFICGAWSADAIWRKNPGTTQTWLLMAFYLLLEVTIVAYPPTMLWLRSLKVGTIVGGVGVILGIILAIIVAQISSLAAWLLLPYLLWSPIGTYTTWEMGRLNPESAA